MVECSYAYRIYVKIKITNVLITKDFGKWCSSAKNDKFLNDINGERNVELKARVVELDIFDAIISVLEHNIELEETIINEQ